MEVQVSQYRNVRGEGVGMYTCIHKQIDMYRFIYGIRTLFSFFTHLERRFVHQKSGFSYWVLGTAALRDTGHG